MNRSQPRGMPVFLIMTACLAAVVLASMLTPPSAHAQTDDALVEISTQINPARPVVPGERARLVISVATPRWFTAGTRIALPEVPGLILLQNQDFASNGTERRGGESWSIQRWTIDLFATEAGVLAVPPVELSVSVSKGPGQNVTTTATTEPFALEVEVPEALAELDTWIASPEVSLEQTLSGEDEISLGSAVTRQITLKAKDVMAMLLPPMTSPSEAKLQTYRDPPALRNQANRGALAAQRRESTTWIAAQPGPATIAGVSINWWNTDTRELRVLTTDPVSLVISGELVEPPASREVLIKRTLTAVGVAVFLLLLITLHRVGFTRKIIAFSAVLIGYSKRAWHIAWDPVLPDRLNPGGTRGASSAEPRQPP